VSATRIGLVGCGRWGLNILRDLRGIGCEVSVADPEPRAREAAERLGARCFADAGQIEAVAGYVIATPTALHAKSISALASRGKPLFVEKPLCNDPADARALLALGVQAFVMDKWRYHPGVRALRDLARSGELGPVVGLRTTRVQWNQPHPDVDAIWILAPHDLSIAREVLGALPEPTACVVESFREPGEGLIAVFAGPPWFVMEVSACRLQARREIRLLCRDGIALMDDADYGSITVVPRAPYGEAARPERRAVPADLPLRLELEAFVGHLRGGPPPLSPLSEGVEAVEMIARLRRMGGMQS
jgi:predicted dehydrogenase